MTATLEARRARRLAARSDAFEVTGSTSLPLSDQGAAWDSGAAAKTLDDADFPKAFFWHDQSKPDDQITSYKLGFASKSGDTLTAIWRGVTAVAGVLQGARGGVKGISASDISGIKGRVEGYYSKAAKQYDDDDIKPPWKADASKGETAAILLAYAETAGAVMIRDPEETMLTVAGAGELAEATPIVEAYRERVAFWTAELAMSPQEAALAAMRDELAASMPACANCGDDYDDHLGTSGPCTADDCDCTSYQEPDDEAAVDEEAAPVVVIEFGGVRHEVSLPPEALELRHVLAALDLLPDQDPVTPTLPAEHKPGSSTPRRRSGPKASPTPASGREPGGSAAVADQGPFAWSAILAPEGKLTSDRRAFAPDAITWRDLPLTLMAMTETSEGGHIGAEVAGRMDEVWRDSSEKAAAQYGAVNLIRSSGVFATTDYGQEIAGLVDDKTLRGVSVDLAISKYVTGPKSAWFNDDGEWAPTDEAATPSLVDLYGDDTIAVVLEAEIGMATVCPFQAFADATIAMGDSLVAGANPAFWTVTMDGGWTVTRCEPCAEALAAQEDALKAILAMVASGETPDDEALVAAGVDPELFRRDGVASLGPVEADVVTASAAGIVPEQPPAEWFANPNLDGPSAIVVGDDGRVSGHAALWGVCHIGFPGSCRTAPHSESGYAYFHLGEVVCDDGSRLAVGQVTLDTGHADIRLDRAGATRHYDHTGTVVAHVRVGEDEHGIWVAGALCADAAADKVRLMRGSKLSGDWRGRELVALLCVNVPGFPVPRAQALAASADGGDEQVALVAAGIPVFETEIAEADLDRFRELRAQAEIVGLRASA